MDLASTAGQTEDVMPHGRWTLAATRPDRLALRLVAAALGVGIVGGMVTACLSVVLGSGRVSPAVRVLLIGFPLVLATMIGWRVATGGSNRWLGWVAAAGVGLIGAVQGLPGVVEFGDGITHNVGVTVLVLIYGAVFGLAPAVVTIVLVVPALLVLRTSKVRVSLPVAQVLLAAVSMVVTAVFTLWIGLGAGNLVGLTAALAGTGAVLTARWCLVDRQA
jgi:hypothetical protein